MKKDKPKIACFICSFAFCQDNSRISSNASIARVNCIGRIDPVLVLEMFEKGVDAVMLAGCKPPDCHYVEGNIQAERTVKMLKKLIALTGLEPERIKLLWYSPLDEKRFGSYIETFTEEIEKFRPSPLKTKLESFIADIIAAKSAASDFRLRVLLGREKELTESVNVYGERIPVDEFDDLLDDIVEAEFIRHKIYVLTKIKSLSVKALAEATAMEPASVLRHIVNMRRKNMIALDHVEGTTPFYKALEVK